MGGRGSVSGGSGILTPIANPKDDKRELSQAEKNDIKLYQNGQTPNYMIRELVKQEVPYDDWPENIKPYIKNLDSSMRPTTEDKIVYRGWGTDVDVEKDILEAGVGGIFVDPAYSSTSQDNKFLTGTGEWWSQGWTSAIHIPKGTPAIDMNKVRGEGNVFEWQEELTLGRGGKYEVLKIDEEHKFVELKRIGARNYGP